jgi:Fibrillar collagen C-terminal domain
MGLEVRRFREHSSFIQIRSSLQETDQRQEMKIIELQRMINEPSKSGVIQGALPSPEKESRVALYRSCEELRSIHPESGSGGYWIDPDGVSIGDTPIFVQCNMTTDSSRLTHCGIPP